MTYSERYQLPDTQHAPSRPRPGRRASRTVRATSGVGGVMLSAALLLSGCSGSTVSAESTPNTSMSAPATIPNTDPSTDAPTASSSETTPTTPSPSDSTTNPNVQSNPNQDVRHTIVHHFGSCAVMNYTNEHAALTHPSGGPWNVLTLEFNNELDQDSQSARQANLGSKTVTWTNPAVLGLEVNASGGNGQRLNVTNVDSRNDPVTANIWNADLLVSAHPHDGDYLAVYIEDDATTTADHTTTRRADRCEGAVMQYSAAQDRWNQIDDSAAPAALQPVFEQDFTN